MTLIIWQRGELEGTAVYQEFDYVVDRIGRAAAGGVDFVKIEKTDTKRVAFAVQHITRIEEVD